MKKYIYIIMVLCGISTPLFAQYSRQQADTLLTTQLFANRIDKVDIYAFPQQLTSNRGILLGDSTTILSPYQNAYAYFIDEMPFANWDHPCKYCFVNSSNGSYTIVDKEIAPYNWNTLSTVSMMQRPTRIDWPYGVDTAFVWPEVEPNPHLWAVLICSDGANNKRFWFDLSCVYTTLTNVYGFMENNDSIGSTHIITMAPDAIINGRYDLNNSGGFVDSYDFITTLEDDIIYNKAGIEEIFDNFSGKSTSLAELGFHALDSTDQLFVYVTGHGSRSGNHSLIHTGRNETLSDEELALMVKDINCSQMTFLFQPCHSGGFVNDLMDTTDTKCKNRAVFTSTDEQNVSIAECYINNSNRNHDPYYVNEFTYYWSVASLGFYPIIKEVDENIISGPWQPLENTKIGEFLWSTFFTEFDTLNHILYDINPDLDRDGYVSMNEAFIFADNLDSWSPNGYYNPYDQASVGELPHIEYPQNSYESDFTKELLTLNGYKGKIDGFIYTGTPRCYLLDDDIYIAKKSQLRIKDSVEIKSDNKCIVNYGGMETVKEIQDVKFKRTRIFNRGDYISLSDCLFDSCGLIYSEKGNLSIYDSKLFATLISAEYPDAISYGSTNNMSLYMNGNIFMDTIKGDCINLIRIPFYTIYNNSITASGIGINLINSGSKYSYIQGNTIHDCKGSGIRAYNSRGIIKDNRICGNNDSGIKLFNTSNMAIIGEQNIAISGGIQTISNNDDYQIYATQYSIPNQLHYNYINSTVEGDSILILYDNATNNDGVSLAFPLDVRWNCWNPLDEDEISDYLYATDGNNFTYLPTWCPGSPRDSIQGSAQEEMLALADSLIAEEKYLEAKETLQTLVLLYANTEEATVALKEMLFLEYFADNDYDWLKEYYRTDNAILSDTTLMNLGDKLANKCDEILENYEDAIDWYERVISDTSSSFADSLFAVIDLGNLYLLMENQGNRGIHGMMTQFIPKSKEIHREHTDYMLSLLPNKKVKSSQISIDNQIIEDGCVSEVNGYLLESCPNPTNGATRLLYGLNVNAPVTITVSNILGLEISKYNMGIQNMGVHQLEIDMSTLPQGIYFYSLFINDKAVATKKIIVKQ